MRMDFTGYEFFVCAYECRAFRLDGIGWVFFLYNWSVLYSSSKCAIAYGNDDVVCWLVRWILMDDYKIDSIPHPVFRHKRIMNVQECICVCTSGRHFVCTWSIRLSTPCGTPPEKSRIYMRRGERLVCKNVGEPVASFFESVMSGRRNPGRWLCVGFGASRFQWPSWERPAWSNLLPMRWVDRRTFSENRGWRRWTSRNRPARCIRRRRRSRRVLRPNTARGVDCWRNAGVELCALKMRLTFSNMYCVCL